MAGETVVRASILVALELLALPHWIEAAAHAAGTPALSQSPPPRYCTGDYADDLAQLSPRVLELEQVSYSVCVRSSATYECVAYGADGNLRQTRKKVIAHGTAFGYRHVDGDTLLLTNQHVAEWPAVSDADHAVDGVPSGCKRVTDSLQIVDSESDDYARDDIPLARVVTDPQLDAAVLRAKVSLPILPWRIGRSSKLRQRNVVEVRGFPLGAFSALNVGKVVSAYDHDDYKDWDHDDFVIDALLSAGNSGSPVLAVSCETGEFELVGLFHAAYSQGSALNVAIGIEQLRDLMTTLKRSPRAHSDAVVTLDEPARLRLIDETRAHLEPFFPFGPLSAAVRPRGDGALVFELFSRDFPADDRPIVVVEDRPRPGAFGDVGGVWFGGGGGLRAWTRPELDSEAQMQIAKIVEALRRDAVAFFSWRAAQAAASTRDRFERAARERRALDRTVESRRDLAAVAVDLADRLAPHDGDPVVLAIDVLKRPSPSVPTPPTAATTLPPTLTTPTLSRPATTKPPSTRAPDPAPRVRP